MSAEIAIALPYRLGPAILRFRIRSQALSKYTVKLLDIFVRLNSEWPRHCDAMNPKGTSVLTIPMMPVHLVLSSFLLAFFSAIGNEVTNRERPEDQKMKQIDIMYAGVTIFTETIFYTGLLGSLPFGLLCVVALCVDISLGIYRRRRCSSSRLLPSWNVS